jgi:hypothetical protein
MRSVIVATKILVQERNAQRNGYVQEGLTEGHFPITPHPIYNVRIAFTTHALFPTGHTGL